jgi:dipeptidyl aminopeptidase/acylaminoacyl peptidase
MLVTVPVLDDKSTDAEALFKEAKRRERRRRLFIGLGAAIAIVLIVSTTLFVVTGVSTRPSPREATGLAKERPVVSRSAFAHHGLLAFVSRGKLWVLDGSNGSLRRVKATQSGAVDPIFSADGKWLAFLVTSYAGAQNPNQLWIARSNGTDAHLVKHLGQVSQVSWSPTNDVLAAVENPINTAVPPTAADAPPSSIWLVSPTGKARMLGGSSRAANFVWSPDGQEIAFAGYYQFGSLEVLPVAGGTPAVWFQSPYNPTYPDAYNPAIPAEWLTKGGILFWIDLDDSSSVEEDGLQLYEIHSAAGQAISLGTTLTSVGSLTADVNGHFAIVSGGSRYAWQTKQVEICADISATCVPVPVPTSDVTLDPSWSPSGSTLAFIEAPSLGFETFGQQAVEHWSADHSLWVVQAGDGQPTQVEGASGASAPVWAVNGKSILYEANDGLWIVPALGKHPVEIASPLFPANQWPNYYAQVNWSGQFDWWS